MNEPALSVSIDLACGALVHRDFQILMDPVESQALLSEPVQASTARVRDNGSGSPATTAIGSGAGASFRGPAKNEIRAAGAVARARTDKSLQSPVPAKAAPNVVRRSVLKLSSDSLTKEDIATLGHLRLSNELADDVPVTDPVRQKEIRAAQNQFAMILRGEDPLRNAELANDAKVTALKRQAAAAQAQRVTEQAAFEDMRQNTLPLSWGIGLGVLLLGSLAAAGWLGLRYRALKTQGAERPWDMSFFEEKAGQGNSAIAVGEMQDSPDEEETHFFSGGTKEPVNLTSVPEFLRPADTLQPDRIEQPAHEPLAFEHASKPALTHYADSKVTDVMSADTVEALQFHSAKIENLKVEEISDIMQEAEFWISLNDSARAIEILEPYAELDSPDSPMPWLFLLDLYVAAGNQGKYALLRERTLQRFNARIATWEDVKAGDTGMTLEDFPHVIERICELWQTAEVVPYLEKLILNSREEMREGFDIAVYREIVLLISIARGFGPLNYAKPFGAKRQLSVE
ncbi:hypothetical protein GCM10022212_29390 [Actimicrobium antarcticum]|uniref:Uncharacterized protein n=2 Tax=Actimicrobium antarcticum TaxID=1051899 RepID=A0ABP7TQ45_9BURK